MPAARSLLRSERRQRAALLLALVAAGATLWQAVPTLGDTLDETRDSRRESRSERELAPAHALQLPPEVIDGAQRTIPRDARYAIVVGDAAPLPGALRDALRPMLAGALLPRRHVDESQADWIVAYGAPTESLGLPLGEQVEVAPGVVVAEVAR